MPEELIVATYRVGWLSSPGFVEAWRAGAATPDEVLSHGGRYWTEGERSSMYPVDEPYEAYVASDS